jgi:hypothetical protein
MVCSVTGGVVCRGERSLAWQGAYLFGDYCSDNVWGLLQDAQGDWQSRLLFATPVQITAFVWMELAKSTWPIPAERLPN